MDVDGERFLTILYVSNSAELPSSVFIRTQIQTAALSGNHRTISWATGGETAIHSSEAMNDTNSDKAEALV